MHIKHAITRTNESCFSHTAALIKQALLPGLSYMSKHCCCPAFERASMLHHKHDSSSACSCMRRTAAMLAHVVTGTAALLVCA